MEVNITSHGEEILQLFKTAVTRGLERCGLQAEGYAIDLVPVDTSTLKQSITHKVDTDEQAAYIGTNNDYAAYVELGTGKYAEGGGGRPTPWVYQDDEGKWHHTHGQRAQPYLRPALADHKQTYRNILKDELENA